MAIDIQAIAAAVQKEGLPWTPGETSLTGLTAEEQRRYLGVLVDAAEMQRLIGVAQRAAGQEQFAAAVGVPAAIDWRNNGGNYVTPIKNQGQCGSCVSFCSCSVIESAVRIKLGNPNYAIDLSEGFLQFCGGGSCNGWGLTSGLDYAQNTGVTDEACMPYTAGGGANMNCGAARCADWASRLTKISSYTNHSTMAARKAAVAAGPVLAGMEVWSDFFAYPAAGGIYVKSSAATRLSPPGYHCVCIIGYDDAQQCWIIKNSWGTSWGEAGFGEAGGFMRMRYGQADLLIDTSWAFSSVVVQIQAGWHSNVVVTQVFTSRDSQNGWAYFQGLGWRKIQTGAADGVTNMLTLFAQAVAKGKRVTIYADGDFVYQAYLL
jgi:C1A family cysteine protease